MKQFTVAVIGCGARSRKYTELMMRTPEKFLVVAGADPVSRRVEKIGEISSNSNYRHFDSADAFFESPKMADWVILGTQDAYHFEPCRKALLAGYDVLLEKPIAQNLKEIIELQQLAKRLNRRVMVCYVLRFSPFYQKVKEVLDSGTIGSIVSFNAMEGVEPWHQAHSFVRGHWGVAEECTPMIVAKCCHDSDIVSWLVGKQCRSLSSFGGLSHFNSKNAPTGSTRRCDEGCAVADTCFYNAQRYAADMRFPWLPQIYDRAQDATVDEISEWLSHSPWGRCVYHCDNTAVDHQVIAMEYEDEVTATFTMTAFESGRHLEVFGTEGRLRAGEFCKNVVGVDIVVTTNDGNVAKFDIDCPEDGYESHFGGDSGLIDALYVEMTRSDSKDASTSIISSVHSHLIAFAAEESRLRGKQVILNEFYELSRG